MFVAARKLAAKCTDYSMAPANAGPIYAASPYNKKKTLAEPTGRKGLIDRLTHSRRKRRLFINLMII